MINEEVGRRVAGNYIRMKMSDGQFIGVGGALIDAISQSDELISDDEIVKIGMTLINQFLEDEKAKMTAMPLTN